MTISRCSINKCDIIKVRVYFRTIFGQGGKVAGLGGKRTKFYGQGCLPGRQAECHILGAKDSAEAAPHRSFFFLKISFEL